MALTVLCMLSRCATVYNKAGNQPWAPGMPLDMGEPTNIMRENSIVLMFSGGGLRAAAFAHGVLEALEGSTKAGNDLLYDVSIISSVSGSSLTSAYYGL